MKKLYQAPKSEKNSVEKLMLTGEISPTPVNGQGGEAPERQGGDFMPL